MAIRADNPCIIYFGPGPDGKTCADCVHLVRYRNYSGGKTWAKCGLRDAKKIDEMRAAVAKEQGCVPWMARVGTGAPMPKNFLNHGPATDHRVKYPACTQFSVETRSNPCYVDA